MESQYPRDGQCDLFCEAFDFFCLMSDYFDVPLLNSVLLKQSVFCSGLLLRVIYPVFSTSFSGCPCSSLNCAESEGFLLSQVTPQATFSSLRCAESPVSGQGLDPA